MSTTQNLNGKKVAFLVTNGYEDSELTSPWTAVVDAGAHATLVSPGSGAVHGEKGHAQIIDLDVRQASPDDFDALVLPGGVINADKLRTDARAVAFARAFFDQHKPVGVICHGPWTLVEAGVVDGRRLTSYPNLRTDLRNAGAVWVDEEVVVDNGLVSSRTPADLPAFDAKLVEEIAEGEHARQSA